MKKALILLLFPCMAVQAQQKLELGAQVNQRWNLGTQLGGEEINQGQNSTFRTKLKYGLGNGTAVNITGNYYMADSSAFFASMQASYSRSHLNRFAENTIDTSAYNSFAVLQLQQWCLNPSVGVHYSIGPIRALTAIGIIVPLHSGTIETISAYKNNLNTSLETRRISYQFSPGLQLSQRVVIHHAGKWNLSANAQVGLLRLKRNQRQLKTYWDLQNGTAASKYPNTIDQTLDYINANQLEQGQKLNDPIFDPLHYNVNANRQAFQFDENMSYFSFGLSLHFLLFENSLP